MTDAVATQADILRPVQWHEGRIRVLDQTLLPHRVVHRHLDSTDDVVDAIATLAVRGAPVIGVCGAYGVALAAARSSDLDQVRAEAARIAATRPTAVNLSWAVDQTLRALADGPAAVLEVAHRISADAEQACESIGQRGADLLAELIPGGPMTVHTHCNAGGLATMGRGTALGVIQTLHERGLLRDVLVDETRPLLQGARLTTFELAQLGIAHHLVVDGAGPALVAGGRSNAVVVGADRIAANGDVANKVGTYSLALAAHRAGIPFLVAAPESTLDPATASAVGIDIEQRDPAEVRGFGGTSAAPDGTSAINLAFDVTPADLVTAIVTERRVIRPGRPD